LSFSAIDYVFVGLITLLMIRCYLRGFISELLSMAALVLGLLTALFFHKNGGAYLRERFWHDLNVIPEIVAFVGLFVIVFLVVKIIEKILTNIINTVSLTTIDSILGLILGLIEGITIVSLFVFILKIQPLFDASELLQNSFFARLLLPIIVGKENVISV